MFFHLRLVGSGITLFVLKARRIPVLVQPVNGSFPIKRFDGNAQLATAISEVIFGATAFTAISPQPLFCAGSAKSR